MFTHSLTGRRSSFHFFIMYFAAQNTRIYCKTGDSRKDLLGSDDVGRAEYTRPHTH